MNRTDALYQSFLEILREELVPAMGCTEPIAIAYAAAQARAVLGKRPERVRIEVSGNIIKNVKSVIVPHTGSMHGIAAAAAAGIIAGREDRELEVLSEVTEAQIEDMCAYLKEAAFEIRPIDSPFIFDIRITVCAGDDQATARIVGSHTNLVQLLHGTTRIIDRPCSETVSERRTDRSVLTVERIVEFADSLCPEEDSAAPMAQMLAGRCARPTAKRCRTVPAIWPPLPATHACPAANCRSSSTPAPAIRALPPPCRSSSTRRN